MGKYFLLLNHRSVYKYTIFTKHRVLVLCLLLLSIPVLLKADMVVARLVTNKGDLSRSVILPITPHKRAHTRHTKRLVDDNADVHNGAWINAWRKMVVPGAPLWIV